LVQSIGLIFKVQEIQGKELPLYGA